MGSNPTAPSWDNAMENYTILESLALELQNRGYFCRFAAYNTLLISHPDKNSILEEGSRIKIDRLFEIFYLDGCLHLRNCGRASGKSMFPGAPTLVVAKVTQTRVAGWPNLWGMRSYVASWDLADPESLDKLFGRLEGYYENP